MPSGLWEGPRAMMQKTREQIAGREEEDLLMEMKRASGL